MVFAAKDLVCCLTNLLVYLYNLTNLVDSGLSVDTIYLDFAKAFDKVPHMRLINKVRNRASLACDILVRFSRDFCDTILVEHFQSREI